MFDTQTIIEIGPPENGRANFFIPLTISDLSSTLISRPRPTSSPNPPSRAVFLGRARFPVCFQYSNPGAAPAVFLGPVRFLALQLRRFSSAGGRRALRTAPRTAVREEPAENAPRRVTQNIDL